MLYHVLLWASNLKAFCNYSLDVILHSWNPFLLWVLFFWADVLFALVFFHFFSTKMIFLCMEEIIVFRRFSLLIGTALTKTSRRVLIFICILAVNLFPIHL